MALASALGMEIVAFTDLDMKIAMSPLTLKEYMATNSISEAEMIAMLDANIREHLSKTDARSRIVAACNSVSWMAGVGTSNALSRVEYYASTNVPERLRAAAVLSYLISAKPNDMPFASNVMTQAWRTPNEHDSVRREYYAQAMSTSSNEEREKYIEFFKWAVTHCVFGNWAAWDDNIVEFDPSWRSNEMRRAAAELQKQRITTPTGTNNILEIIRDYEIASGICKPEPPPPLTNLPAEATSSIPPPSASVQAATGTDSSESAPVETTRRTPWLGAVLVVVVAAIAVIIIRRSK